MLRSASLAFLDFVLESLLDSSGSSFFFFLVLVLVLAFDFTFVLDLVFVFELDPGLVLALLFFYHL
jgi:hypothetical protein